MKRNRLKTVLTGLLLTGATLGYSPEGGLRLTVAEAQAKHEDEGWREDDRDASGLGAPRANANSQMPTDGDYSCWNWEDQSYANWKKKIGSNWEEIVSPPFSPSAGNSHLMFKIAKERDYEKIKGWELVWANFQTENPYFILYNRHRSIVRVFFYLDGTESYSHIMMTLSFNGSNNPAILSAGKGLPTDAYNDPNNPSIGNDDMMSVVIPLARKHWGAAEFPIVYDPNIQSQKYQGNDWIFNVYGIHEAKINLTGVMGTNSDILNLKQEQYTMLSPKSAASGSTFSVDYAKVHKQIKDIDGFLDEMKKYADKIDGTKSSFLNNFKGVLTNVSSSASSWGSAIAGVSSTISAALGFVNLVTGIFGGSTPPPATIQYINLQGTITDMVSLEPIPLTIPGTSGSYYPANNWNPFNCPMGIINLKTIPTIKKTTPYNRYGNDNKNVVIEKEHNNGGIFGNSINGNSGINDNVHFHKLSTGLLSAASDATEWHLQSISGSTGYRGRFIQYKFDDEITLATQTIEGLTLQDLQVAIVCKPVGTSIFKYTIYDRYIAQHEFYYGNYSLSSNYNISRISLENPVYKALIDGRFVIHKFDESNDEVYFGTPFMDRNQLKSTVFEVPEHTEVKLAVYARFSSDRYEDPIIFKAMYDLKPAEEQAKLADCPHNPIFPNYCDVTAIYFWQEIANFGFSDYCRNFVVPELPTVRNLETENTDFNCNRSDNCPPF